MTRLFIPEIGTHLTLSQDWTFTLFKEDRNVNLWNALGFDKDPGSIVHEMKKHDLWAEFNSLCYRRSNAPSETKKLIQPQVQAAYNVAVEFNSKLFGVPATLPKDTILNVDRIYIRKGASDFSSISFFIESCPDLTLNPLTNSKGVKKGKKRFWAKLEDVNCIEFI